MRENHVKKHIFILLSLSLSCILFACRLYSPSLPSNAGTVELALSCLQDAAEPSGSKAIFSDDRVDSVSVEVLNSAGTTLGTVTLIKGASAWTGSMNVTVSGSETLAFKARAYATAYGTVHYYGESTMLISESDVSVSISIPTALWHSVWTNCRPVYKDYVATACSSDGTMLVVGTLYSGNPGSIWTSTDSGVTWVERTSAGIQKWMHLASSADGMKLAAIPHLGYIWTSTDAGNTWTAQTAAGWQGWQAIASSADGTKLAAVPESGYVWTSADSGLTWNQMNSPNSSTWFSIASSADGTKLAAVMAGANTVCLSTDSGLTWTNKYGRTSARRIACSADGTKLFVVGSGYIHRSLNSGATWTTVVPDSSCFWDAIACSSDGTKIVIYDTKLGYPHISTDSGATWTTSTGFQHQYIFSLASSDDGTKLIAGGTAGALYTSSQ